MIHREDMLALLGFPRSRDVDIHDSEPVLRAIKLTDPNMPIDLILHTSGGTRQTIGAVHPHAISDPGARNGS
jgi:ClpP class serine protease